MSRDRGKFLESESMDQAERDRHLAEARARCRGEWVDPPPEPVAASPIERRDGARGLAYATRENALDGAPEGEDATPHGAAWDDWLECRLFGPGSPLARGLVLGINQIVAAAVAPLEKRIAELEARARKADALDRLVDAAATALQRFNGGSR